MSTFNPGDVVRLKSGGPKMTVRNKKGPIQSYAPLYAAQSGYCQPATPTFDRPVTCDWFMGPPGTTPQEQHHKSETFEEESLVAVEP